MQKIAIIGAGVSGLSCSHFLRDRYDITVYEKEETPGGLIRCNRINGSLFHTCGGHVFNSKRQDVIEWFWEIFDREKNFSKAERNASVHIENNNKFIPYPIENHMYLFNDEMQKQFYRDLDQIDQYKGGNADLSQYSDFGDFLLWRFGKTLYELYFRPYNEKVWRCDLSLVPMSWMDGKLPMPTTQEIREANMYHKKETTFVHSSFWYEKQNGSQYLADQLAEGINVKYKTEVKSIEYAEGMWHIAGEKYDKVIFCGNVKDMVKMIKNLDLQNFYQPIEQLQFHGTTSVFCEIDRNPYSWIYLPSTNHRCHRIICTGNFATSNNGNLSQGRITATIEFTGTMTLDEIIDNLKKIPFNPSYIAHKENKYTYPIQHADTRELIQRLKRHCSPCGLYFTGRFADWEYYNMDIAMGAAKDLCKSI